MLVVRRKVNVNMASARKKQDERNLKILRELVSLPHNKHCFDCNQRGPTYVNVTIGSFVCTKCSGTLRGLTPPHRVKSISMATFTSEEVDFVKNRGNDYCRRTFLGLYDKPMPTEPRDELQIHDFMIEKYEKRRYYLEPSLALRNGQQNMVNGNSKAPEMKKPTPIIETDKAFNKMNGDFKAIARHVPTKTDDFVADFASADIFNAANNNSSSTQPSFANFDNNPIFNNFNSNGAPPSSIQNTPVHHQQSNNLIKTGPPAPPEDRYAALKDLDNALKAQPTLDWNSGSNNSLCSSSTTAGSLYSTPSPQSSMYGSPSQSSQFSTMFPQENTVSNPFNNGSMWNTNGTSQPNGNSTANPFRNTDAFKSDPFAVDSFKADPFKVDPFKTDPFKTDPFKMNGLNGFNQSFQPMAFPQPVNGTTWTPNPFKIGAAATNGHSNNPFL